MTLTVTHKVGFALFHKHTQQTLTDSKRKPVRSYSLWSSCRAYDFPDNVGHFAKSCQFLAYSGSLVGTSTFVLREKADALKDYKITLGVKKNKQQDNVFDLFISIVAF